MKPNVPNVIYRIQARMAIARNRGTIMLIALLSTLFLLLSQAFLQMGMNRDANALITLLSGASDGSLTNAGLVTLTDRILAAGKNDLLIAGGCVLAWVLTAFLSTGRTAAELKLIRGQEITIADALSRAAIWHKAIAHRLYLIFRIVLWMVPGFALMMLGQFLAVGRALANGGILDETALMMASMFQLQGMAGMFFLSAWAYLRYSMSGIILADRPETGVLESVRLSKAFVKGRLRRLILMALTFLAGLMMASWVTSSLTLLSPVLGLVTDMAVTLFILLYYDTTLCVFYLDQTAAQTQEAEGTVEKSPLSEEAEP